MQKQKTLPSVEQLLQDEENRRVSWEIMIDLCQSITIADVDIIDLPDIEFNDTVLKAENYVATFNYHEDLDFDMDRYALVKNGNYYSQFGIEVDSNGHITSDKLYDQEAMTYMSNDELKALYTLTIEPDWEDRHPKIIVDFIKSF